MLVLGWFAVLLGVLATNNAGRKSSEEFRSCANCCVYVPSRHWRSHCCRPVRWHGIVAATACTATLTEIAHRTMAALPVARGATISAGTFTPAFQIAEVGNCCVASVSGSVARSPASHRPRPQAAAKSAELKGSADGCRHCNKCLARLQADQLSSRNNSEPLAATMRRSDNGSSSLRATSNIHQAAPALPRRRRRRSWRQWLHQRTRRVRGLAHRR
jgi:hypothetical protein